MSTHIGKRYNEVGQYLLVDTPVKCMFVAVIVRFLFETFWNSIVRKVLSDPFWSFCKKNQDINKTRFKKGFEKYSTLPQMSDCSFLSNEKS